MRRVVRNTDQSDANVILQMKLRKEDQGSLPLGQGNRAGGHIFLISLVSVDEQLYKLSKKLRSAYFRMHKTILSMSFLIHWSLTSSSDIERSTTSRCRLLPLMISQPSTAGRELARVVKDSQGGINETLKRAL